MGHRASFIITVFSLVFMLLSGCSFNNSIDDVRAEYNPPSDGHYPVHIATYNYNGVEVITRYEKAPEKVLAVYQGSIETMLALGLEDKVIAAAGLDSPVKDEWQDAFDKINYLDSFSPDRETVMLMQPDMILSWGSYFSDKMLGDVDYWHENGTMTYINSNTIPATDRKLENEYTDILNIGKIFNVEDRANKLVDDMKRRIQATREQLAGMEVRALVIEFYDDEIKNYGASSLAGDMITSLSGTMVSPNAKSLGKEDIIKLNPDVIFISYMERDGGGDADRHNVYKLTSDPAFASLDAVKNGRVLPIMLGDMYASGVRTMDGIEIFSQGLLK